MGMFALGLALLAGCRGASGPESGARSEEAMPQRPIAAVLADHTPELMRMPGVVGTAEGESGGKTVFLILVDRATPELSAKLPREIEGYRVEVRETGTIRPLEGKK